MNGKTHMMVGLAVSAVIAPANPLAAASSLLGSLLPDIDHPQSKLGRRILPASWLINNVFGHRTITHSLFVFCAIGALTAMGVLRDYIPYPVFLSFLGAYGAHIICDMLTPQGVPLAYPLPTRFRFPLVWRFARTIEFLTLIASTVAVCVLSIRALT